MKRIIAPFFLLLSILLFSSCSPTYLKVARNFAYTGDSIAVLILPPGDNIIFNKVNTDDIDGYDTMSVERKKQAEIQSSLFLKDLNNHKVYNLFVDEFINYLSQSSLKVYTSEFENEFNLNDKKVIVKLSQLQFDEYIEKVTDEQVFFDSIVYYNDVYLNAFAVSLWVDMMNPSTAKPIVLFASDNIKDYHEGVFYLNPYTDEILYEEDDAEITIGHIQYFIKRMAKQYANYTFDYILNEYMDKKLVNEEDKLPDGKKVHADIDSKILYYYEPGEWGFIPISN